MPSGKGWVIWERSVQNYVWLWYRCFFLPASWLIGSSSWGIMNKIMQKASCQSSEVIGIVLIFFLARWHNIKCFSPIGILINYCYFFSVFYPGGWVFCCKISSDSLTQNYMKCYTCFTEMKYLTFNAFPCLIGNSNLFSTI